MDDLRKTCKAVEVCLPSLVLAPHPHLHSDDIPYSLPVSLVLKELSDPC